MKRILILFISLLLVACSTSEKNYEIPLIVNDIEEKFDYTTGKCLIGDVPVKYLSFDRGQEVSIAKEDDNYYYVDYYDLLLAVEKDYIRTANEEEFKEYTAYTRAGASLYSDTDLSTIIKYFSLNDTVRVIDSFAGLLLVQTDNETGYMLISSTSKEKISTYVAPRNNSSDSSGGTYTPPSSGGGSSTPSAPTPSSGDGEDISIYTNIPNTTVSYLAYENTLKGKILKDDTDAYITFMNRDDVVYVLNEENDILTILIDGLKASVERKYVRMDNEKGFDSINVYTRANSVIYGDYLLRNKIKTCSLNEIIKVIDEFEGRYIVELDDGSIGYILKYDTSLEEIKIAAPRSSTPTNDNNGGGSSSGDSTPSTPSSGGGDVEWTEPVL